jgi:hypothetical protein
MPQRGRVMLVVARMAAEISQAKVKPRRMDFMA